MGPHVHKRVAATDFFSAGAETTSGVVFTHGFGCESLCESNADNDPALRLSRSKSLFEQLLTSTR